MITLIILFSKEVRNVLVTEIWTILLHPVTAVGDVSIRKQKKSQNRDTQCKELYTV